MDLKNYLDPTDPNYIPWYQDDADYNTNAKSFSDALARNKHFLKLFTDEMIRLNKDLLTQFGTFKNETNATLEIFNRRLDNVQQEMINLFNQWLADGTLDEIINQDILNSKASKEELNYKGISISQYKHLFVGNDITAAVKKINEDYAYLQTLIIDLTPVSTYQLKRIDFTEKNVIINAWGSTLLQVENEPILNWSSGYGDIKQVTSVQYVKSGDGKSQTFIIMSDSNHGFNAGDKIKIFSNDLIPERHQSRRFMGELCTVESVEGNKVILANLITNTDNYKTGIQAVRFNDLSFKVTQLKVGVDKTKPNWNTWTKSTIRAYGGVDHEFLRIKGTSSSGALIELYSVYGYTADYVKGFNLPNDPNASRWGYIINDVGCTLGKVTNILGMNVRHAYTTNSYRSETELGHPFSGRTTHATIQGRVLGGTSAGFDTHPEAQYILFKNCHVENASIGYQSRSIDTEFRECVAEACQDSYLFTEALDSTVNNLANNLLKNCQSIRPNRRSIFQNTRADTPSGLTVDGGRYDQGNNAYGGLFSFHVKTSNILLKNLLLYVPRDVTLTGYVAMVQFGSSLNLENIVIDVTNNTFATTDVFVPKAITKMRGFNIQIKRGSTPARLNKLIRGDDYAVDGKFKNVLIDVDIFGDLFTNPPTGSYLQHEVW